MLAIALTTLITNMTPLPPFLVPKEKSDGVKGHAVVDVVSDVGWIGPGQEFHVVVVITPDVGWHTYWENPGDSGSATVIEIEAPEEYKIGEPIFPRPEIFYSESGKTFGYGEQVAIFIPVTAPPTTLDGRVDFEVTTTWLACRKRCVQGEDKKTLTASVRTWEEGPQRRSKSLANWRSRLPKPLEELKGGRARLTGNILRITGNTTFRHLGFVGIDHHGVRFMDADMPTFEDDLFTLQVPVKLTPANAEGNQFVLEGLLTLGRKVTDPSFLIRIIIDTDSGPDYYRGDTR